MAEDAGKAVTGEGRSRRLPAACLAALVLCLSALGGWLWGFPALTRLLPELPSMKFNGALAFGALALAAIGARAGRRRWAAAGLVVAAALGLATLLQYALGVDLGLDQWAVTDPTARAGEHPGRMAVSALACLLALCAALALQLRGGRSAKDWSARLASVALAVAYVGSMGLLAETRWTGPMAPLFGAFSLPTAAVILLLGIAVLEGAAAAAAAAPLPVEAVAGRRYLRVALPLGLLIPVSTAWASTVVAMPLGWPTSTAPAVALAATGLLVAWLVLGSAGWISRLESALRWERQALEIRVRERTAQWQEALRGETHARQRLDLILDGADMAVVAVDPQARVCLYNPAAERLFGRAAGAVLGGPMALLMPAEVQALHARWVDAGAPAAPTTPPTRGLAVQACHARGDLFPAEAVVTALPGDPPLLAVVLRDLSEARALEHERVARGQVEVAHRARLDLMAKISHELRTPLNAILGFSQLLGTTPAVRGDARATHFAELIAEAGRSLLALADDLSDLRGDRTVHWHLTLQPLDLALATQRCVALVRGQAQDAGVECRFHPSEAALPPARADEQRVRQILLNLLGNAIKYNRRGGRVTVSVVADGPDRLAVHVGDTGPGLDESQQQRIFEAYERAGREGGDVPGQGLGLAIARELARAMGGDLTVRSRVGEGSVFTLGLPRQG